MLTVDALLINPISARTFPAFVPHGLLYIAAYAIQQGYRVAVYDRNTEGLDLGAVIKRYQPRIVGLGCLTGTAINDAVYISREIRKINFSIKIIWGGIHTTLYPDSVLKEDFVDFVVLGDGEHAVSHIIGKITGNAGPPLESIDNLGYKEGGRLKYNRRSFVDMATLAQPAWQLIDVEKYVRRKFYARRVLTINTSRGCPYKCAFCCVPSVHQGKWRALSAEAVIANLKYLKENYGINGFQVDDDEFDIDRNRVLMLCDLLRQNRLDLKWSHFSRINIVREDVLRRERESGLSLIEFGVESGSPRILEFLNKCQTLEQIDSAYSLCKRLGVKTSALFMIGLPGEKEADLKATTSLIKRLNPYITICNIYRPYPGSELFEYSLKNNLFKYADKLEDVSKIYASPINTSDIPYKRIAKIKRHFDVNNIYQEIKFILTRAKFDLMWYYFFYYLLKPLLIKRKAGGLR